VALEAFEALSSQPWLSSRLGRRRRALVSFILHTRG
jgi:hypothetical protein